MKKLMLCAASGAVMLAFAAPAQATTYSDWTANGNTIGEEETYTESYEGFIGFTTPGGAFPLPPVHSTFGCDVTVTIHAEEANNVKVTEFSPTTSTCRGTGVFSQCKLKEDKSNPPWAVDLASTNLTVTGPITITNVYEGCPSGVTGSELTFNSVTAVPTLNGSGGITSIAISGTATNGVLVISGTVVAQGEAILGVE